MINITDKAIKAINKAKEKDNTKLYVRVGIKGGTGCDGFGLLIQFESDKKETDIEFTKDGATVIIDPKSSKLLGDFTLDYHNSLMKSEFKLTSNNIKSKCGCGKSIDFK